MRRITTLTAGALASLLMFAGCSATGSTTSGSGQEQVAVASADPATDATTDTTTAAATTTTTSTDVDWDALPSTDVVLTDDGLTITDAGTYVLSGTTTGQVSVDTEGAVRIVLDDATIDSATGAAIQVDGAEQVVLELADGSTNTVSAPAAGDDADIDAAIYSTADLVITGDGALDLTAAADGIDGRANLSIESGTIAMSSGDKAIHAEQSLWVGGGTLTIDESVEGLEAPVVVIDGGDITLNASDDGINASTSDAVSDGLSITVNGGSLTITMADGDTDAIDSNGDLTINGGTVSITAQSPFDFDGNGTLNGGTITVNGEQVTELSNQMMGGPGQMGDSGQGGADGGN